METPQPSRLHGTDEIIHALDFCISTPRVLGLVVELRLELALALKEAFHFRDTLGKDLILPGELVLLLRAEPIPLLDITVRTGELLIALGELTLSPHELDP